MSNIERAINNDEIYSTPTPLPKADTTWLEARELLAHTDEDKQYSDTKKDLRFEIREVRRLVSLLIVIRLCKHSFVVTFVCVSL